MGQGTLLFDTNSSGSASQSFLQDAFNDIALPATSNAGFSSTVSTNPLSQFFGNDNQPRFGVKTLWIKDLVLLSDRTLWVNDKPTYQVIWHEDFPAAKAYVYGTISLTSTQQGNRVDLARVGDGFGVGGIISRVQWLVETSTAATATAQQYLDNVATTTIDFSSGATAWDGQPKYNAYVNAASNSSLNLHDYRLVALQANTLSMTGVIVYYEIPGLGINCFGGDSYLNKQQIITVGSTLSIPTVNTVRGGRGIVYKTIQSTFGVTVTPIADVTSIATGTNATNLLNLSTGTGASFPRGTAVYIPQGSSIYIGNVLSQSTDTLTMGVTLPYGISGTVYQLFQAGHTAFPVTSAFEKSFEFNASLQLGSGSNATLPASTFAFSDPTLDYRLWGATIATGTYQSVWGSTAAIFPGLGNSTLLDLSSTASFLQVDGNFQALEFEFAAGISGLLSATLSIDGMAMYNFNDNLGGASMPGFFRKTIMTNAGPGFHSVNLARATGWTQVALTKVTGYVSKVTNGPTFGALGSIGFGQTFLPYAAVNASLPAFGNIKRIFADSLPVKGSWTRGTTASVPGAVAFYGGSNSVSACTLNFQYYGTAFALLGVMGLSNSITIDGSGTSALANTWLGTGLSNTFHSVVITASGQTVRADAIDFVRPQGGVKWLNNFSVPADSSFFEMRNSQLSLKASSITSRELATSAVQRSNLGPINQVVSASSGNFVTSSGTPVDITNLSATITSTTGRPIVIELIADGDTSTGSYVEASKATTSIIGYILFQKNGVSISLQRIDNTNAGSVYATTPPAAWRFEDISPGTGANTYKLQAFCNPGTTGAMSVVNCKLQVTEKA
jgi:hypothetical protein